MNYKIIFGFLALSIGQGLVYGGPPDPIEVISVPSDTKLLGPKSKQLNNNKENTQPNAAIRTPGPTKNAQPLYKPGANSQKPGANSQKPGANSQKPGANSQKPVTNPNQQNARPLQPSQQNKSQQSQRISTANPNQQNRQPQQPRAAVSAQPSNGRVTLSPQKQQANAGNTRTLLSPAPKPVSSPAQNSPSKQAQQGPTSQQQTPEASNQQTQERTFVDPPQEIEEVLRNVLNVANEIIVKEAELKQGLYFLEKVDKWNINNLQDSLIKSRPKAGITHDDLPTMVFNVLQKILLSDAFEEYVNFGKMDDDSFISLINGTLRVFTYLFNIEELPEINKKELPESASYVIKKLGERISMDGFSVSKFLTDKENDLDAVLKQSQALKGPDGSNFNVGIIKTHFENASKSAGPSLVTVQN